VTPNVTEKSSSEVLINISNDGSDFCTKLDSRHASPVNEFYRPSMPIDVFQYAESHRRILRREQLTRHLGSLDMGILVSHLRYHCFSMKETYLRAFFAVLSFPMGYLLEA